MAKVNSTRDTLRLCKLTKWNNYPGYGFNLTKSAAPPFTISIVDSNSPAAAANLKIKDVILEVNKKDMLKAKIGDLTGAIQKARDTSNTIELLVMEKRHYDAIANNKGKINRKEFSTFTAPATMPAEYANFPKNQPRTCLVQLKSATEAFGFEIASGEGDTGAYIQDVKPNSPASAAGLRKSDRVLAIDGETVESVPNSAIMQKLKDGKAKMALQFFVMDTHTYKHYKDNGLSMQPPPTQPPTTTNPSGGRDGGGYDSDDEPGRSPTSPTTVPPRGTTNPYGGGRDRTPPRPSLRPTDGISALATGGPLGTTRPDAPSTSPRRRVIRLRRHARLGYGFRVDSTGFGDSRHRVVEVTRDTPAEAQGLRVNESIVSVNDRRVTDMTGDEFKQFLTSTASQAEARGDPLVLEVLESSSSAPARSPSPTHPSTYRPRTPSPTHPSTYRPRTPSPTHPSTYRPPRTPPPTRPSNYRPRTPSPTHPSTYRPPRTPPPTRPSTTDRYPELRQCTIRASPGQNNPGFNITQSSDAYRGANGFQIESLQASSPAKSANVRNNDYIIEVDDRNVESDDLWDIRDAINNAYKSKGQVKLLVIDEAGYRWYKERRTRIDPRSADARVTKHATADSSRPPERGGNSSSDEERAGLYPARRPPQDSIAGFGGTDTTRPGPYSSHGDDKKTSTSQYGTKQPSNQAGSSATHGKGPASGSEQAGVSSTISGSRNGLSRGAVDVISTTSFLRFYHIKVESGQKLGIDVESKNGKHVISNVQPNSPANRAGLQAEDYIVEVQKKNVEFASHNDVMRTLKEAVRKNSVSLLVAPSGVLPLTERSKKSQKALGGSSNHDDVPPASSRNRSDAGRYGRPTDQDSGQADDVAYSTAEPTDPLPRKCVLKCDPNFNGCGFRVSDRPPYDTPIIVEVAPDSPAKRSGLSEGDHIIYVDSENVQHIGSFGEITAKIQRHFQDNGHVSLVTLTGPAFQILKKRGGYLEKDTFDYQSHENNPMHPRLCKLKFSSHEQDYGLAFRRQNMLLVKSVQPGSSADALNIEAGNVVLELNGESTRYMSMNQVKDVLETSKQQGDLKVLVIDVKGYRYSTKHAIPLNSMLPFVKTTKEQLKKSGGRAPQEPVYL